MDIKQPAETVFLLEAVALFLAVLSLRLSLAFHPLLACC